MKKLGQLLLQKGWITRTDLHRALRNQGSLGGRLGTCLLETGALSEDLLHRALGEQLRLEPAEVEELRQVSAEVVELLPRKLAVRCSAVPLRATSSKLYLAMLDPGNLGCQDEIAFATSRRLVLQAAGEARIREALERYYGEPADTRTSQLLDQLNRRRYLWKETADEAAAGAPELFPEGPDLQPPPLRRPGLRTDAAATAAGAAPGGGAAEQPAGTAGPESSAEVPQSPAPAAPRRRPSEVALSADERNALYGGRPPAPLTVEEAEARLQEVTDRDAVGRLLVSYLRQSFERVLLFGVRPRAVVGWMGEGEGLDPGAVPRFSLPFDKPSIFLNLRQGSAFHLGSLPPLPGHRPLLELLGGETPAESLLLPVRIGERMVAVLYCDHGAEPLGGVDLEALRDLTQRAAEALERCILLKRQGPGATTAG